MKSIFLFCFAVLFVSDFSISQLSDSMKLKTPSWVLPIIEKSELMKSYEILDRMNPFYFEDDFNDDGFLDIVMFVRSKMSGKEGVVIVNGGKNVPFIFGAGKEIGMGSDISWCNQWFIYRDKFIYNFDDKKKKFMINHHGIEIVKSETTSVVIYWDRRRYKTHIKHI
ncbi:MAG: hypothetical protein MK105_05970 [Crocinitomicaceae bacterium]|nr:hypothetical protein [Crocinitomicaceae bacterium]